MQKAQKKGENMKKTKEEITSEEVLEEENLETSEETTEEIDQDEDEVSAEEEEKDSDDEFMEDLTEAPLDAEKAKKKRESLIVSIENCRKTADSLRDLAEANKSGALKILKEKVKDSLTNSLEKEDIKDLKDGVKQLESVKVTLNLISTLCGQYAGAEADIARYERQLKELKEQCVQLSLPFDEIPEETEEEKEEETAEETTD